jgi:hypothetical protein
VRFQLSRPDPLGPAFDHPDPAVLDEPLRHR